MKTQEDKQLEQLVTKAMQKATLETPSFQFTDRVMAAVKAEQQRAISRYAPLIPKYIWISIAAFVVGITAYLWFYVQTTPIEFPNLSFDFMQNIPSQAVSNFRVSNITGYAFLLLAVMICVQIPVLKRYFERRWAV